MSNKLYKDIHILEDDIVEKILEKYGLYFEKDGLFVRTPKAEYDLSLEQGMWDIVVHITAVPEQRKFEKIFGHDQVTFFIEYKSHINEWGKQIDEFFRQINKRKTYSNSRNILLSFDPEFKEYEQACIRAGITLIVLSKKVLLLLK